MHLWQLENCAGNWQFSTFDWKTFPNCTSLIPFLPNFLGRVYMQMYGPTRGIWRGNIYVNCIGPICRKVHNKVPWASGHHMMLPTEGSSCQCLISVCPSVFALTSELFWNMFTSICLSVPSVKHSHNWTVFYWCRIVDNGIWLCQVQRKVLWNTNSSTLLKIIQHPSQNGYVLVAN